MTWIYRREDAPNVQGICMRCGLRPQRVNGKNKRGEKTYKPLCRQCHVIRFDCEKKRVRPIIDLPQFLGVIRS